MKLAATLTKWPLLAQIRDYRAGWVKSDLAAGISVAAVSIPSAIAYPAIAGLPMEVGAIRVGRLCIARAIVEQAYALPSKNPISRQDRNL